jgi:hypothetical protein
LTTGKSAEAIKPVHANDGRRPDLRFGVKYPNGFSIGDEEGVPGPACAEANVELAATLLEAGGNWVGGVPVSGDALVFRIDAVETTVPVKPPLRRGIEHLSVTRGCACCSDQPGRIGSRHGLGSTRRH